jgi:hypothetical protein
VDSRKREAYNIHYKICEGISMKTCVIMCNNWKKYWSSDNITEETGKILEK